jgi:putative lipoic acid-binding regulatory protein
MDIQSDNPEHGFQFPGQFELCAMGLAEARLELALPQQLAQAGIQVLHGAVTAKPSSNGKYVSVRIPFLAASREQHDRAHLLLREHPDVKWTL